MKNQLKRIASCTIPAAIMLSVLNFSSGLVQAKSRAKINTRSINQEVKIFSLPEDTVARTNGTASFTVVPEPAELARLPHLQFQWQKNGTNILNATRASLIITNVQISDVGFYTCMLRKTKTAASIIIRGADSDAPGARLFVYSGTNTSVTGPYQPSGGSRSCIGSYLGYVTFKVPGTQSTWFSRPAGMTSGTITDTTGLGGSYSSKVEVVESYSLWSTCAVQTVSFPAQAYPPYKYQFTTCVTSGAPPSGTPLSLDIQWFP